ncbi:hypothetical protein BDZ91DRAFT_782870 [Kalaharituber pfeilii]|nr:hypothetical protein BDZ91DRAFT_782870 [Kalaharituber pfeilii]
MADWDYDDDDVWVCRRNPTPPPKPGASSTPVPKIFPTDQEASLVHDLLTTSLQLPVEIALMILDYADYMPTLTARMAIQTNVSTDNAKAYGWNAAMALLVTDPIPKGAKVKSVTWWTKSNDQGWSTDRDLGEYSASWTWFEACGAPKLRLAEQLQIGSVNLMNHATHFPEKGWEEIKTRVGDVDVSRWVVQRNARAKNEPREHVVEWRKGGGQARALTEGLEWGEDGKGFGKGFVEALREGDRVVLVGRSMNPGWVNYVLGAEAEVRLEVAGG